jgi:hypothetical protein
MAVDPKLFSVESLLAAMFDDMAGNNNVWRKHAEIILGHRLLFPKSGDPPNKAVVKYGGSYLRRGCGRSHFWDCYPDDFGTPEWALLALLDAPVPPFLLKKEAWKPWTCEHARLKGSKPERCSDCDAVVETDPSGGAPPMKP